MIKSKDFGFNHIFINSPSPSSSITNSSNNKKEYDYTNKKLTLVLLHGTGGTEEDLIFLGKELEPTASILSPRGKVLENGMPRFLEDWLKESLILKILNLELMSLLILI